MTDTETAIKELLDRHCIWNSNANLVERVKFALDRMGEYADELANNRIEARKSRNDRIMVAIND